MSTTQPTDRRDLGTPRPWFITDTNDNGDQYIGQEDQCYIAIATNGPVGERNAKANAALIVAAVNEHDGLLAENQALREALEELCDVVFKIPVDFECPWADEESRNARAAHEKAIAVLSQARGGKGGV